LTVNNKNNNDRALSDAYHYPSLSKRSEQAEDKANEAKQSPKAVAKKVLIKIRKKLTEFYQMPIIIPVFRKEVNKEKIRPMKRTEFLLMFTIIQCLHARILAKKEFYQMPIIIPAYQKEVDKWKIKQM
jgi:hypothetical protein